MNVSLQFPLNIEDDWPPVGSESLPFERSRNSFKALAPPLFVKDLSVGDIIRVTLDADGFVDSWKHLHRSDRTTVWLLRFGGTDQIELCLADARALGCNTVGIDEFGCYSIDVPAEIPLAAIDEITDRLDPNEVAVAFPSLRHVH